MKKETISISSRDEPKHRDIALCLSATDYKVVNTPRHQAVNAVLEKNEDY